MTSLAARPDDAASAECMICCESKSEGASVKGSGKRLIGLSRGCRKGISRPWLKHPAVGYGRRRDAVGEGWTGERAAAGAARAASRAGPLVSPVGHAAHA
jgi:hypothetical protein